MPSTKFLNELCVKITLLFGKNNITICNAVYFWLCVDLMHITPPVTAEGYDGSRITQGMPNVGIAWQLFDGSHTSEQSLKYFYIIHIVSVAIYIMPPKDLMPDIAVRYLSAST